MKLYFLRHADALEGANDEIRPISDRGMKQSRTLARFLMQAGIRFDAAWSSPLVRAQQTAEIILENCNDSASRRLQITDCLLDDASQKDFNDWLRKLPESRHILLVGHAPTLAERVRRLLGISLSEALELPKAGLACLATEDRRTATLKFLLTPKLLGI